MRVYEVAQEFDVSSEALVQLLREMAIPVRSHMTQLGDEHVARLRTVLERERRRKGQQSSEQAIEAAIEDAQSGHRRRRRRKTEKEEETATDGVGVSAEADSTASPVADAAEAMAAEAAMEAAERGADLVTSGGAEPTDVTVVVESAAAPPEEAAPPAAPVPATPVATAPPASPPRPAGPPPVRPSERQHERRPERAAERHHQRHVPSHDRTRDDARAPRSARPDTRTGVPPRPPRPSDLAPPPSVRRGAPPAPADTGRARPQADGVTAGGQKRKKKDKKKKGWVDQEAVDQTFRKTMAAMESGGRRRRRSRDTGPSAHERREEEQERIRQEEAGTVRVNEFLTVAELAELIDVTATQIVSSAFKNLGLMVTINQRLDFDQIELLLDEFGFRAVREEEYGAEMEEEAEPDSAEDLEARPPVVTVMGHVDHGKTSLLDHIRKTNVIAGEAGGITQHIGAYHVELEDGRAISFLDTPGHAAFTAMRARGAEVTDVVILVVAADDSVMPQTIEAISHAKNAGVPIVVAVNKVDLPDANPMRVKQDLLQHGIVLEEFGGDVMSAEVSAKRGMGIDDLLDKVLLQSEILELQANPNREAHGVVIEAQLDVGKGPVATVLVTNGTLRVGDNVVCGHYSGRIRAMLDERGNHVDEAGPAIPVQILGLPGVPGAGDQLLAMDAVRAGEIAQTRQRLDREKRLRVRSRGVKLTDISKMLARGERTMLNLVIKGDVDGSVQALSDALEQLSTSEVEVQVIHRGVGAINESDVLLASTSGAIVIGFHVRPSPDARAVAEREDVDVRLYNIIYEAVGEVRAAMEGLLSPEEREVLLGTAEVRQLFKVPRVGTVAGCMVTQGELQRRSKIRVIRDGVQIYEGELGSLKRFKDDAREVREGFECGLNVTNFNDIKVGDIIEAYRVEEVARTLAGAAE
ncbi:MAG: translation initiation factor IF-2 [Gemmatimonadetes bacterium]|nr:translation initiation factor IF-2 [Gemmatimonadota bacterium]